MPGQCGHLLKRRIFPNYDLVVRIAVGAHQLFGVFGKHQIADLRACVYAVHQSVIKGVPKLDGFVGRSSSAGQYSVVMGTPSDSFDCSCVLTELANGSRALSAPNKQFIIVTS